MGVLSTHPLSGFRLELERPRGDAEPFVYSGHVREPERSVEVSATLRASGEVEVTVADPAAPEGLAEKVRLLVRAACRHATTEGRPPPLRIQRWRGEK